MRKSKLSKQQIDEMVKMYSEGAEVKDLAQMFGISVPSVYYHAKNKGIAPRGSTASSAEVVKHRRCAACNEDSRLDAKFCWKCGFKFKGKAEIVADELQRQIGICSGHLPQALRDPFRDAVMVAVEQIKNTAKD